MMKYPSYLKSLLFYFGGVVVLGVFLYIVFLSPPSKFIASDIITIEEGSSLRSISRYLKDNNMIRSRIAFETLVISFGGEKHILPGDYFLEARLGVIEVARRLANGDRNLSPVKITIPEGFDIHDISEVVALKLPSFSKSKFLEEASAKEGYLFPDTYFFFTTDNELDVIKLMSENFYKKFNPIRPEIEKVGKTEEEIIIMASIIEREAKGDSDRELISGILWARLARGMRLQVDAAPITYKEQGLPESAISNPGIESIKAAIYPKSSPYLFYLHGKDGEIRYAKTFEEHRQNKLKYLR